MERRNSKTRESRSQSTAGLFSQGSDMGPLPNVQGSKVDPFTEYQQRMIESAQMKAASCIRLATAFQDADLPIIAQAFLDMGRILPEFIDKQITAARKLPKVE